jgi:hypothetical protein
MARGKIGDQPSTYNAYTRQSANFVFPIINDTVNGENRPRPGKFRIKDEDAIVIDEGKNVEKINSLKLNDKEIMLYTNAINNYISSFTKLLSDLYDTDKNSQHTLHDDIKNWRDKYNSSLSQFLKSNEKKSSLFEMLNRCSPKFINCIFNILKSKGPVLVYSNYVMMEGLQIFKIYLRYFNFIDFHKDKEITFPNLETKGNYDGCRYVEYHGAIERQQREMNKKIFNDKENVYGRVVKIIMISPAGAEGITLHNTRQVHILEPFWNEARIEQITGRAIRFCVHKDLPMEERKVDVFRYKMVRKNNKETADEKMERISRKKNNLLMSFIDAVKEASVDCELFKAHNMMGSKYKCFQFNEDALFQKPVGPAYQKKEEEDIKIDNGSNSIETDRVKIKVRKIKAVKKTEGNIYSEPDFYWLYDKSGVIYDYNSSYPVGKISKDMNDNFEKLDNDIYIIDNVIDIPEFKIF